MRKSNLMTIAAAGLIVALAGGTGAYAGNALSGDAIQNGTLDSSELQDGTVRSVDLKNDDVQSIDIADGAVRLNDLAPGVSDTIRQNMEEGGQLDANGKLAFRASGPSNVDHGAVPAAEQNLVTLSVTGVTAPTKVTMHVGSESVTCVAAPAGSFEGTCSATGLTAGGPVSFDVVDEQGVPKVVTVVVSATRIS